MAAIFKEEEFNFFVSCKACCYVSQKVEVYTRTKLESLHKYIYARTAALPPCTTQCSQKEKDPKRWCKRCMEWRKHLATNHRHGKYVKWEIMHSWLWQNSYLDIAEVFLPLNWSSMIDVNLADLSTAGNIWKECRKFNLKTHISKNLLKVRNLYFAHNLHRLALTDKEKGAVFDALFDLIRDGDLTYYINPQDCVDHILAIQNEQRTDDTEKLNAKIAEIMQRLESSDDKERLNTIERYLHDQITSRKWTWHIIDRRITLFAVLVFGCIMAYVSHVLFYQKTTMIENEGEMISYDKERCLSETFSIPFPQDLQLLDYLKDHTNFTGRKWLLEEIKTELLSEDQSKGLILFAPIGYGKSAIVKHLVCPTNGHTKNNLTKQIVAFHVCRFDVEGTRSPERFIRRLVGFLSKKSPLYGGIVSMLPNTSVVYSRELCNAEPEACFDQGVVNPLIEINRQIKLNERNDKWIILIDALDECFDSNKKTNQILNLLTSRIRRIPDWTRFLITSRNISFSNRHIKEKYLHPYDTRNRDDIKRFIGELYHGLSNSSVVDELLSKSEGIFLYVLTVYQTFRDSGQMQIPSSLEEIYEINFDRQFDTDPKGYLVCKAMLEVIMTSLNPMDKRLLCDILLTNGVCTEERFDKEFRRISPFLLDVNGIMTLVHKSVHEWLLGDASKTYRVSLANGHKYISSYLLSNLSNPSPHQFINLTIHVAEAESEELTSLFKSINTSQMEALGPSVLHILINQTSSLQPLKLLLLHFPLVNYVDLNGLTPIHVAAKCGNLDQLIYLQTFGGNLTSAINVNVGLDRLLNGFTAIHLAAKQGHINVVFYVLSQEPTLMFVKTNGNQRALDIACEYGHIKIVKGLAEHYSKNESFSDCLYFAAKSNQKYIYQYMKVYFEPSCIYNVTMYVTELESMRDQRPNLHDTIPVSKKRLVISRKEPFPRFPLQIIFRETPLHAAIRYGATDAAIFLIHNFPSLLECTDMFGYTPALLAIRYNQSALFPSLCGQAALDKCSKEEPMCSDSESCLEYDSSVFEAHNCPSNASFAHIIAIHNTFSIAQMMYNHVTDLRWDQPDAIGYHPIHYAAKYGNGFFINSVNTLNIDINAARTSDGSTPYHVAAQYGQYHSLYWLTDGFKTTIPVTVNDKGFGVLHSLVYDDSVNTLTRQNHDNVQLALFKHLQHHNITMVDYEGRNILHYILLNGDTTLLTYLLEKYALEVSQMSYVKDKVSLSPFGFAIDGNDHSPYVGLRDIIITKQSEIILLNTRWEIGLDTYIRSIQPDQMSDIVHEHLGLLSSKSTQVMELILTRCQGCSPQRINNQIAGEMKRSLFHSHLATSTLMLLDRYGKQIHKCGVSLRHLPVHSYVFYTNTIEHLTTNNKPDPFIQYIYFRKHVDKGCTDDKGLGLFHYSLMGGNIPAAEYLFSNNFTVINSNVSLARVINMAVFAKNKPTTGKDISSKEAGQGPCIDMLMAKVIRKYRGHVKVHEVCRNTSFSLSLVHLLAISGMTDTLGELVNALDVSVLACTNTFGLTPLYLAMIWNHTSTIRYLSRHTALSFPPISTERAFLLMLYINLRSNLFNGTFYSMDCIFNTRRPMTNAEIVKTFRCFLSKGLHSWGMIFDTFQAYQYSEYIGKLRQLFYSYLAMNCTKRASRYDVVTQAMHVKTALANITQYVNIHEALPEYFGCMRHLYEKISRAFPDKVCVDVEEIRYICDNPLFRYILAKVKYTIASSLNNVVNIVSHVFGYVWKRLSSNVHILQNKSFLGRRTIQHFSDLHVCPRKVESSSLTYLFSNTYYVIQRLEEKYPLLSHLTQHHINQ